MNSPTSRTSLGLALAALSLATAGLGAVQADTSANPLRCAIDGTRSGASLVLTASATAEAATSGSYRFQLHTVAGAGSTDISQGGGFSAGPGDETTLGQIMVGARGAVYEARLELDADGRVASCNERFGSI